MLQNSVVHDLVDFLRKAKNSSETVILSDKLDGFTQNLRNSRVTEIFEPFRPLPHLVHEEFLFSEHALSVSLVGLQLIQDQVTLLLVQLVLVQEVK